MFFFKKARKSTQKKFSIEIASSKQLLNISVIPVFVSLPYFIGSRSIGSITQFTTTLFTLEYYINLGYNFIHYRSLIFHCTYYYSGSQWINLVVDRNSNFELGRNLERNFRNKNYSNLKIGNSVTSQRIVFLFIGIF